MSAADAVAPSELSGAARPGTDLMQLLCRTLRGLVGVDHVAVVTETGGDSRFTWSDPTALTDLASLEHALATGPCRQVSESGVAALAASVESRYQAWPGLRPPASLNGIRAVSVWPLHESDGRRGTLVVLSRTDGALPSDTVDAVAAASGVATSQLAMMAERQSWRAALDRLDSGLLHDQLTGLPNRGLIHELTFHTLAEAHRHASPVVVLFVDLDHFAAVNTTWGHAAGDVVLQKVALRLRAAIRSGDSVGRLRGDQFLVVCQDLPAAADEIAAVLSALADRIRTVITEPIMTGGSVVTVTASIGIALTHGRQTVADLIHEADIAMLEAKALGPGGTVTHAGHTPADPLVQQHYELRLFDAFRRDEFEVYYQPVYGTDRNLDSVEALIRWNHPTDGVITAAAFIDTAAAVGLIVPLGQWVIATAMSQLRQWRDLAPGTAPRRVWCNLGPLELVAPDLSDVIAAALEVNRLVPGDLGIEVLEQHLDDPRLTESVTGLHAAGHPLALDDFGTGYSSLSRLVDLPVSHLKIDRSLVTDLPDGRRSQTLVTAVMTIAANLDVTVISEGIETSAQAEYLTDAGSDLFQGYHFGRPVPAAGITDLLADRGTSRPTPPRADAVGAARDAPAPGPGVLTGTDPGAELTAMVDTPLFQQLPTAYLVMSPGLVIVDANVAYVALLGHRREDLVGRPVFDVFPPTPEALDPDGSNPLQLSFERARDTGRPDVMPLHQYDVIDPASGVLTQRFWSLISAPVIDITGTTRLVVQRVEDVTDWVTVNPANPGDTAADRVQVVEAELFVRMQELQAARAAEATALAALRESEARARAVLETAADGIVTMNPTGAVQSINPAAERMFGYPASAVLGRDVSMLIPHPDLRHHRDQPLPIQRNRDRSVLDISGDIVGRRSDGSMFPIEAALSEVTVGSPFYTGVLRDISERRNLERQLAHQSTHDPLTGLANRTLLLDRLQHAVARLARHPGLLAVFFIDLDQFKPVNDLHGHAAGDQLLTVVAARLRRAVRDEDLVARWGGDEFVVLCEEIDNSWVADVVADRVRTAITEPAVLAAAVIQPSASIGHIVDDGTRTPDQLLAAADDVMYLQKNRNRRIS